MNTSIFYRCDLQSAHWQTEIEGLAAIVRLIKYHSEVILEDIEEVMNDLNHECKNLRSQVCFIKITLYIVPKCIKIQASGGICDFFVV